MKIKASKLCETLLWGVLSLIPVSSVAAQNLLANGDAETGTLAGWTTTGPVAAVTRQGQQTGIVFPFEGSFFFTLSSAVRLRQPGPERHHRPDPGHNLTLSGVFQTEFDDTGEAIVRVFDENGSLLTFATTNPRQMMG